MCSMKLEGGPNMDIKDIKDSIVLSEETFTKRVLFADDHVLSFVLNFKEGQTLPVHKHEKSTVVFLVLSGSGEVRINNEVKKIEKGSVVMAKGEDDFAIPKVYEDMSLFVTISPNPTNQIYSKELG